MDVRSDVAAAASVHVDDVSGVTVRAAAVVVDVVVAAAVVVVVSAEQEMGVDCVPILSWECHPMETEVKKL